jgi:hypothetical protein
MNELPFGGIGTYCGSSRIRPVSFQDHGIRVMGGIVFFVSLIAGKQSCQKNQCED